MPRQFKGIYLAKRGNRYVIRNGTKRISTGTDNSREAHAALTRYIAGQVNPESVKPQNVSAKAAAPELTVAEALMALRNISQRNPG